MHGVYPRMHRIPIPSATALILAAGLLGFLTPNSLRAEKFPPLNAVASAQQVPGKFVWADMFTNEPEAAAAFYCSLFGWTSMPVEKRDKSYIILSNGDHPVAGMVQRDSGTGKRPSIWIGYISSLDASAALARAVKAGATERAPATNFKDRGYQAILSDVEGAPVGILQSTSGDRPDEEPKPGDWNWFEYYSLKPEATASFYATAFGYEAKVDDRPDKAGHVFLTSAGRARAGIAPLPAAPDARAGWLGCLRVADIDATLAKATTLGGQIIVQPRPAALGSRFAVIADPTGGEVGLVQYVDNNNPANKP